MRLMLLVAAAIVFMLNGVFAEEDAAVRLQALESQIEKTPDDPMLFYRKAQCLMELGKAEEGYRTAKDAMALFIKKGDTLSWLLLEKVELGNIRVDVHFNMGPDERKPPEIGIIRPLSFRVWSKDGDLLDVIDFELGLFGGKPSTAALGKTEGGMHMNFGMLDVGADYSTIKSRALDLVKNRHSDEKKQQTP